MRLKQRGIDLSQSDASMPVSVRRKRVLPPVLRPRGGRTLVHHLRPEPVFHRAQALPDGVAGEDWKELVTRIDESHFHADTQVEIFTVGAHAFAAMLQAIAQAQDEVLVEAYILRDDSTGHDIMAALSAAAARGVQVRVLADAFGSSATRHEFWTQMRAAGTRVHLFRRPRFAPQGLQPILDHRKLLIIDRCVAFTGGMNIADEYRVGLEGDEPWRDTHLSVRGDVAWELALIFAEGWEAAGGDCLDIGSKPVDEGDGAATLVLDSRPGRGQGEVFSAFAAVLGGARKRVWISNAYFAPSRRMTRFLCETAKRGVDLRLLVPAQFDLPFFGLITRGYYAELLSAGVRIFEYQPAVMHAKTLVADDDVSIIGSTNFDFRSFDFNAECNLLLHDGATAAQMSEIFCADCDCSLEVTRARWFALPRWKRTLYRIMRVFAPLV